MAAFGRKMKRSYAYCMLHCQESNEIFIFQRSRRCNWGELRFVEKSFQEGRNAFYLYDQAKEDMTNTIYLGEGYPNRNPDLWVLPGGECKPGSGASYALEELYQETGVEFRESDDYETFADPSGRNMYSILIVPISAQTKASVMETAAKNFDACNEYRVKLATETSVDNAKANVTNDNPPPLISDELCAVDCISIESAIQLFKDQGKETDWFLPAAQHLARRLGLLREQPLVPQSKEDRLVASHEISSKSIDRTRETSVFSSPAATAVPSLDSHFRGTTSDTRNAGDSRRTTTSSHQSPQGTPAAPRLGESRATYKDKWIRCTTASCSKLFCLNVKEQQEYHDSRHDEPKCCHDCRRQGQESDVPSLKMEDQAN
eukprot:gene28573-34494_t